MSQITQDEDNENPLSDECTSFDAESHVQFFKETCEVYDIEFDKWVLCFISDNVSVNERISRISNIPHIG